MANSRKHNKRMDDAIEAMVRHYGFRDENQVRKVAEDLLRNDSARGGKAKEQASGDRSFRPPEPRRSQIVHSRSQRIKQDDKKSYSSSSRSRWEQGSGRREFVAETSRDEDKRSSSSSREGAQSSVAVPAAPARDNIPPAILTPGLTEVPQDIRPSKKRRLNVNTAS